MTLSIAIVKEQDVFKAVKNLPFLDIPESYLTKTKNAESSKLHIDNDMSFAMSHLVNSASLCKYGDAWGEWRLNEDNEKTKQYIEQLKNALEENNAEKFRKVYDDIVDFVTQERIKYKNKKGQQKQQSQNEELEETPTDKEYDATLEKIKQLDPFRFEKFCGTLLQGVGGNWRVTKRTGDGGLDVIGYHKLGIVKFKIVVQVKRYTAGNVNKKEIRDFVGAIDVERADRGVFITTSSFHPEAESLADTHNITLINGDDLVEMIKDNDGMETMLDMMLELDKRNSVDDE